MEIKGDLALIFAGGQVPVEKCNIAITQPTLKEICAFGEDNFFISIQLFVNIEKAVNPLKEGNSRLAMLSDFQVLMVLFDQDIQSKTLIQSFFELIMPNYVVRFDPGSLSFLVDQESNKKIIGQLNPMNFEYFQETLKRIFLPKGLVDQTEYNPANEAAAKIAEKLKKGNEKRQQLKAEEGSQDTSLFANYLSVLSVGTGISLNLLLDYTPFQIYDAYNRYTTKLAYDLYQKIATTPMMDVSKMKEPKNWMEDLYK